MYVEEGIHELYLSFWTFFNLNTHTYLIFSHFNDCKRLQSYYHLPTPSLHSFTYVLLTTHLSQFVNVNCECPQGNIQFLKTYLKVG